MPTRFYISAAAATYTPTSPATRGSWTNAASTLARALTGRPSGATNVVTQAIGVNTNLRTMLNFRAISEPAVKAGTLSGTMQWMIQVVESNAALNAFFYVHAWVTVGDSSSLRGTLLANSQGATEWPTTAAARTEGAKAITSVDVSVGDRIVIEFGYLTTPASSSTTYTGQYRYGGTGSTDLTANSTDTTQPPWVEFSGGEDIWAPALSSLTSDFSSMPAELSAGAYGATTPTATGGRLRITATGLNDWAGVFSDGWAFSTDGVLLEIPTVLTPGSATSAYIGCSIIDSAGGGGRYIGTAIDSATNTISFYSWLDYFDGSQVDLTYNATSHRWVRVRRSGQSILWDTSPDGQTWTNRRTLTTGPSWMNYHNLALLIEAYKNAGPTSYAEGDNLNSVPANQNLDRAISDAVTVAEAVARIVLRPRGVADTVGVAETLARLAARSRAIGDTVTAADSIGRAVARPRAGGDTVGLADTVDKVFSRIRGIADTVTVAEAVTRTGTRSRAGADTLGLADALTRAATNWPRPVPDTLGLADANTRQLTRPRGGADTVGLADTLGKQILRVRGITDTVTVVDTATGGRLLLGPITDTVTLADAVTRARAGNRAVPDTVTVADALTRAPLSRTRPVTDAVTVADTAARAGAHARAIADAVALAATVARVLTGWAPIGDAVTVGDYAGNGSNPVRDLTDTVTTVDEVVAGRLVERELSDSVYLDEVVQLSGAILTRDAAETLTLTDDAARELQAVAEVTDTVTAADGLAHTLAGLRGTADTVVLVDTAAGLWAGFRTADAAVTVADIVGAGQAYTTGVADTVELADAVDRAVAGTGDGADTVTLTGSGVHVAGFARPGNDYVVLADQSVAGRLLAAAAADTVHLAEMMLAGKLQTAGIADTVHLADTVGRVRLMGREGSDFVNLGDATTRDRVLARTVAELLSLADLGRVPTSRARSITDLVHLVDVAYAVVTGPSPILIVRAHTVRQVPVPQSITVVTPVHGVRRVR